MVRFISALTIQIPSAINLRGAKVICAVRDCLALVREGHTMCPVHAPAALAKTIGGLAMTASGRGGQRCLSCRRIFREGDWVWRQPVQPGPPPRYRHVDCAPPAARESPERKRASLKPLLVEIE